MPEIRPARPSEQKLALTLLERGLTDQERQTRFDRQTLREINWLVAVQDDEVLGAVGWQIEPNRTALLWMPRCQAELDATTAEAIALALIEAATQKARQAGLDLIQATLSGNTLETDLAEPDRRRLQQSGYTHLANLLYLVSTPETMSATLPEAVPAFEPYEETEYERLLGLLEATYEGTLDCPGLNGVQSIGTVLDGYREVGRFLPQNWYFVRHQGQDVGALLLAEHPDSSLFELVYMGLIPEARGQGHGYHITRFAQWCANAAGVSHLVVAVDETNRPAVNGYQRAGFFVWDRRVVHVNILS